ncbi:MAG: AAA family ATPase [Pseudonocardia sp.]|nr:AAA family ATPase [Pseudonocardia sp.]
MKSSTPLGTVTAALERLSLRFRQVGDQVDAQCPAHEDANPSLSVTYDVNAGKVLANCHAGCPPDDVVAALGLSWTDLFDPRPDAERQRGPRTISAVYPYTDELGEVLFEKVRYNLGTPKYQARRPDGRGGYVWKLEDVRRVLYRLPELRAAIAAQRPIVLCEGEKDADRVAEQLGLAAPSVFVVAAQPGQRSSKWRREYTEMLRGARVLIVADNDEPGTARGRAIASALDGVAAEVKLFRPAVDTAKADMSDHLDAGHRIEDLVPLDVADRAAGDSGGHPGDTLDEPLTSERDSGDSGDSVPPSPAHRTSWTAAELMQITFPTPRWAVPGVIAEGVNLLAGAPKIGKSWMSLALAVDVATGGRAFGTIHVVQGDVLYLALEDTGRRLQNRLKKVLGNTPAPAGLTLVTTCPPFPEGAAHITAWLDKHPDARLIVIDVFAKMKAPDSSTSAYSSDYAAVAQVKHIADNYGVAVILVHHVRKQASEDFLTEVSGTNGIAGAADAILVLKRTRGSADGALHMTGRDVDETEHALTFDPETGRWSMLPGPAVDHLVADTRKAILEHLRAHPKQAPKQIADGTGLAYDLVKKTCQRMNEDGQILSQKGGRYSTVPAVPAVPFAGQDGNEGVPGVSPAVPETARKAS